MENVFYTIALIFAGIYIFFIMKSDLQVLEKILMSILIAAVGVVGGAIISALLAPVLPYLAAGAVVGIGGFILYMIFIYKK